jgi:hypothetical protein
MQAFNEGDRVRYLGMRGPGVEWYGREGVVVESYRNYDGERARVQLDGAWSFGVDQLESVSTVPVGTEVRTRSGVFPSVPYVKQEDGSWKPKYAY